METVADGSEVPLLGYYAVFDGHYGSRAADFAADKLKEVLRAAMLDGNHTHALLTRHCDALLHGNFTAAVLKSFEVVDEAFSEVALNTGLPDGTTTIVVLLLDGCLLVANLGDSRALLCQSPRNGTGDRQLSFAEARRLRREAARHRQLTAAGSLPLPASSVVPVPLSIDHDPNWPSERSRIEASGGFVTNIGGIWRLMGELAVSRAFGDMPFRRYGLIAEPEVSAWRNLSQHNNLLVIASDGLFETLSDQEVCDIVALNEGSLQDAAERLREQAYEKASMDNIAVVLVDVNSWERSETHRQARGRQDDIIPTAEVMLYNSAEGDSSCTVSLDTAGLAVDSASGVLDASVWTTVRQLLPPVYNGGQGSTYLMPGAVVGGHGLAWQYRLQLRLTLLQPPMQHLSLHALPAEVHDDAQHDYMYGRLEWYPEQYIANLPSGFASFLSSIGSINLQRRHEVSGSPDSTSRHHRYTLHDNFARGAFGDIWRATRCDAEEPCAEYTEWTSPNSTGDGSEEEQTNNNNNNNNNGSDASSASYSYILKRILVRESPAKALSALREAYFGQLFRNITSAEVVLQEEDVGHIVEFHESFERNGGAELWLVFEDAGTALASMLYAPVADFTDPDSSLGGMRLVEPSSYWRWLKTTEAGQYATRNLLQQLLQALRFCHAHNITHRDVKPENMVLMETPGLNGLGMGSTHDQNHLRLVDFGSALDNNTIQFLYGKQGPTIEQETPDYAPPEALYDIWSVGVVMLELALGTPHVFNIDARTRALLERRLMGENEHNRDMAYKLRALLEMCIFPPRHTASSPVSWACTEEALQTHIKMRDPLNIGMPDVWSLRLLRRLLQWSPDDRITSAEALEHAYFHASATGFQCSQCPAEFEFAWQLDRHRQTVHELHTA
eukprot:jgi/Chlat1/8704/Chrsp88S08082